MGAATPSPESAAVTTEPSSSWNVAEPAAGPTAIGVNCTSTEHDAAGAIAMPEQASVTSENTPGTSTVTELTRRVDVVALVRVTAAVRRPASTTVGANATGDANGLTSGTTGSNVREVVVDDERRGTVVAGTVGNEPPVLGNRGMIGVAGTVVPGTVGRAATSSVVGGVAGGVVGGVVGTVGTVVVVVCACVVVSTTSTSDERRSTAQTDGVTSGGSVGSSGGSIGVSCWSIGVSGVAVGSSGSAARSVALAKISQRPCCEIERRPTGVASASSAMPSSVVVVPSDDSTRMPSPR